MRYRIFLLVFVLIVTFVNNAFSQKLSINDFKEPRGDYSKTLEISTRCGQDSDCNPASAGGILGTMLGYSNIPDLWMDPLKPVEDMDFRYTTMSLNDVYEIGTKHALAVLQQKGGKVEGENIILPKEEIKPVQLEVGFKGHYPIERKDVPGVINAKDPEKSIEFTGNGFALTGWAKSNDDDAEIEIEMTVDGGEAERFVMPVAFRERRHEVAWKYQLPEGKHTIKLKMLNLQVGMWVDLGDILVYSSNKIENTWKTN
jgi:hypothetical protein